MSSSHVPSASPSSVADRPSPSRYQIPLRTLLRSDDAEPQTSDASSPFSAASEARLSQHSQQSSLHTELDSSSTNYVCSSPPQLETQPQQSAARDFCFCQRSPKIPRPRNAFILYRQHHASSIKNRFPHLSNPEISKQLGRDWNSQTPDVKACWNRLAEEEKRRHRQQHPGYRYQPRRSGRRNSTATESSSSGTASLCSDCGRQTGLDPATPDHPPSHTRQLAPAPVSSGSPKQAGADSMAAPPQRRNSNRPYPTHINVGQPQYAEESVSPGAKRRRMTATNWAPASGYAVPTYWPVTPWRGSFGGPMGIPGWGPPPGAMPPMSAAMSPDRTQQLSGMTRPPVASPNSAQQRHDSAPPQSQASAGPRQNSKITLPPIQMAANNAESLGIRRVSLLSKIAPPLKSTGPVRGVAIAIEGDSPHAVNEVFNWLDRVIREGGRYAVRTEDGPRPPGPGSQVTVVDYLDLIRSWHQRAEKIKAYITTAPEHGPLQPDMIPVALLHHYQVYGTTEWAKRVSVNDTYNTWDHWTWIATLWRGVVGADLTIYVVDAAAEDVTKASTIEVREDVRCIIVRRENIPRLDDRPAVDEATLRRLSFEVSEWMRHANGHEKSDEPHQQQRPSC